MTYEIWQVREKNDGSKIWAYAIRKGIPFETVIDYETQSVYNKLGEWHITGYRDFPKFFRWDYTGGSQNENYH